MPHNPVRRTAIATLVALTSGLAYAQAADANAVADSPTPAISIGAASVDVYGPAGDLDIDITGAPAGDAYVRLDLSGSPLGQIRITDDAGSPLPITEGPGYTGTVTVGAQDTDHNGIAGAPLHDGTIHLHVTAGYPAPLRATVYGALVDGASGKDIVETAGRDVGAILPGRPLPSFGFSGSDTRPGYADAIATGSTRAAEAHITTYMGMLAPPPATHTIWNIPAKSISAAGYTPAQLAAALHVSYSLNTGTYTPLQWVVTDDGSLRMDLPAHSWQLPLTPSTRSIAEALRLTADWGLPAGVVGAAFDIVGDDGRPYTTWYEALTFTAADIPARERAALYGRDSTGVLWQYQATSQADHPGAFDSRTRVGGGWNIYDRITALGPLKADGTGDVAARDKAGVLWYYRDTGNPAAPLAGRVRVGGGWNIHDQILGAGDITGDGHPDLLARDTTGDFWYYRGTGNPAAPYANRTLSGGGMNIYNTLL